MYVIALRNLTVTLRQPITGIGTFQILTKNNLTTELTPSSILPSISVIDDVDIARKLKANSNLR